MKHRYQILSQDAVQPIRDRLGLAEQVEEGGEVELELSAMEEKAMVAAGWISEQRLDEKDKGGKK